MLWLRVKAGGLCLLLNLEDALIEALLLRVVLLHSLHFEKLLVRLIKFTAHRVHCLRKL